jgi:cobalt-zinc-cadmium efflux system outer membrane protein
MADSVRVPEGEITLNDPFDAQQATLLYSPESSRLLAELAMHDANYWQATLLKNPGLGVELMRPEQGGRWSLGFKLELSLLDWLSRQHRLRFAEAERLSWQAETLTALNQLLRTTSQQWLTAVAARHKTQVQRELLETTQVAAELAKLLHDAGNISELAMLGYASVAAQQAQHLMLAELAEKQTLSRLRVVSGLPYATQISIPANLPAPPETTGQWLAAVDAVELIVLADQHQPALELARRSIIHDEQQLLLAERRLGLRQAGLSLETERKSSAERYHGFGIDISPPLFDRGNAEISGLDARLQQSKASMEWQNLTFGSDIEQNLDALRTSFQR